MISKFLIFSCFFSICSFASPTIELLENAKVFLLSEGNGQLSIDEAVCYVLDLREQILALGYEVPSLEELTLQLEDQLKLSEFSNKSDRICIDSDFFEDLQGEFYYCSESDDDTNWGMMSIGGCEILGGALLAIIPWPFTRKIAAGMIVDGLRRILNVTEEIEESNQNDAISQSVEGFYD